MYIYIYVGHHFLLSAAWVDFPLASFSKVDYGLMGSRWDDIGRLSHGDVHFFL